MIISEDKCCHWNRENSGNTLFFMIKNVCQSVQ